MTYEPSEHIDEALLGRFVLDDTTLGEQREDVELHLRTCEGCSERFQEMKEYYSQVQSLVRSHEQALVTTERVLPSSRHDLSRHVDLIPRWNPVARFLIRYPVAASAGVVGLFAAAVFLMLRPAHKDTNPSYLQAKEGFLIAYNKIGEELFRKRFSPELDLETYAPAPEFDPKYGQEHYFTVADVDSDGMNEVLLQLGWLMRPGGNSILCFNADGSERWRFQFKRNVKIESESVTDDFLCRHFSVRDFDGDETLDIVALFRHSTFSPSAIVRVNAATGALQGEYWHAGWLYQIIEFPMPGSRITKIVAGGTNNGLRLADLLVLDPRNLSGQAPTSDSYRISTVGTGSQELYITFPRNGPEHLMTQPYNAANTLYLSGDTILMFVSEQFERQGHPVAIVQFDLNMNIVSVTQHNDFLAYIATLQKNGASRVDEPEVYLSRFRSGIRFWNGKAFVPESKIQPRLSLLP